MADEHGPGQIELLALPGDIVCKLTDRVSWCGAFAGAVPAKVDRYHPMAACEVGDLRSKERWSPPSPWMHRMLGSP